MPVVFSGCAKQAVYSVDVEERGANANPEA